MIFKDQEDLFRFYLKSIGVKDNVINFYTGQVRGGFYEGISFGNIQTPQGYQYYDPMNQNMPPARDATGNIVDDGFMLKIENWKRSLNNQNPLTEEEFEGGLDFTKF